MPAYIFKKMRPYTININLLVNHILQKKAQGTFTSKTFALSTEHSFLLRLRAVSNAIRAIRSIWKHFRVFKLIFM